jgi:GPH family glycoside/pentoside/hexuronide:cation symporter
MQQSISTGRKVLYGAGDIMATTAFTVTALFLPYFFTDVIGLPVKLAGLIILIGNIWDALIDPFIGRLSDRTRTRFGRRRPFFLYMALPIGASFLLLFSVPGSLPQNWLFTLSLLAYIALLTTTSFYLVPYLTYGMEIERSYDGRTSLTAWRMLFSIALGLAAAVLPKMIWEAAPTPSQGFLKMALIFAIPIALSPLMAFFSGKEPKLPPPEPSHFFRDFMRSMKNKDFFRGMMVYVATWVGINAVQTLLIYYFKYVVGIPEQFEIVVAVMFGVAILALPLWVWISKKLDKRKAFIIGAGAFAALMLTLLFPGFITCALWVILPLWGVTLSALHVMPTAILPEAIENADKGESKEGTHFGIVNFVYMIVNAPIQFGALWILGLAGYIETKEEELVAQPASALLAIRILIVAIPVVLLLLSIISAKLLRIRRKPAEQAQGGLI